VSDPRAWSAPVALLLLVATVAVFPIEGMGDAARLPVGAWLGAGLSVLYAVTQGRGTARLGWVPAASPAWTSVERLGLAGIVVLAAALRLWQLDLYPAWVDYDDVQNGWIGLELVARWRATGHYQAVLTDWASGNESAFMYIVGFVLETWGVSIAALRTPTAIAGTLTIAAVYLLARRLGGPRLAQASSLLAAIAPWHVQMSREAKQPHWVPMFVALALWLLARALDAPAGRRRWRELVCCGAATGAGLHFYEAFRIFPIVVVAAIAIDGRRRLARAALEVGAVGLAAAVVASPLLLEAAADPGNFMMHVSSNSVLSRVAEEGSLAPLASNAAITLHHVVFVLPRDLAGTDWLPSAYAALPPLILAGALSLLLGGPPRARLLLVATAVAMAAPFILPRFDLASPRRYGGELVPMYLAAGAAALGLARGLARAWGHGRALAIAALGFAALASELPTCFEAMTLPPPWLPSAAQRLEQRRLRWVLERAQTHTVWLSPELARDDYFTRFCLRHPRIRALATGWPLPGEPFDRPLTLVGLETPARTMALSTYGATEDVAQLTDARGTAIGTEVVVLVDPARLAAWVAPDDGAPAGFDGLLMASRAGPHAFDAACELDGEAVAAGTSVALSWGAHSLRHVGGAPLAWRPPDVDAFAPIPRDRLWRRVPGVLGGPRVVPAEIEPIEHVLADVPSDAAYDFNRSLQDLEPDRAGGFLVLDSDLAPLKRWNPVKGQVAVVPLVTREGAPFANPLRYRNLRLGWQRLAADGEDVLILDRDHDAIHRFVRGIEVDPVVSPAPGAVADLALDRGALALALPDTGTIAFVQLTTGTAVPPPIGPCTPVALAILGDRLAYVDRASAELVVHERAPGTIAWGAPTRRIPLARAGAAPSLALAPDGRIALTDGERGDAWLFDAGGALLAVRGEPRFLRMLVEPFGIEPVAVAFGGADGTRLALVGRREAIAWREHPSPDGLDGITLAAHAWEPPPFNLNEDPAFAEGLAVDRGEGRFPAGANWRFEVTRSGRYVAWALYATDDPRPLELHLDGVTVLREADGHTTGGYARRFLRWQRLGELELTLGPHRLRAQTYRHFPHLARIRLVGPRAAE